MTVKISATTFLRLTEKKILHKNFPVNFNNNNRKRTNFHHQFHFTIFSHSPAKKEEKFSFEMLLTFATITHTAEKIQLCKREELCQSLFFRCVYSPSLTWNLLMSYPWTTFFHPSITYGAHTRCLYASHPRVI